MNLHRHISVRKPRHVHLFLAITLVLATAPISAAEADAGKPGDPDSWKSAEFKADWGLDAIGAHHAYARGLTGTGVKLGLLDGGVYLEHSEFSDRNHVSLDLSDPDCATYPLGYVVLDGQWGGCVRSRGDQPTVDAAIVVYNNGNSSSYAEYNTHGTHVAGTMVAKRDGQGMHGVAFGSQLISGKLFTDQLTKGTQQPNGWWQQASLGAGSVPYANQVSKFYDAMLAQGARVANIEVALTVATGSTIDDVRNDYESELPYYTAFAEGVIRSGVVNVVALGNDSGSIANIYPGLPAFRPDVEPYWLSVANLQRNANGSLSIASTSSRCSYTKNWCISAPGTDITSSVIESMQDNPLITGSGTKGAPYTVQMNNAFITPTYGNQSGTSMAAPHAAGALGLLFERFPYLTGPQVRDVLLTTATDLGAPGVDDVYGWGMINLQKAIDGPGMLLKDTTVVMNQRAGGIKVWEGDAWDDWRNDISGPGRLGKAGAGWLRLSGRNSFNGLDVSQGVLEITGINTLTAGTKVTGGSFLLSSGAELRGSTLLIEGGEARINGNVSDAETRVAKGGTLRGTGRLANTRVEGTIAPGNSIGTLTINGDYTQTAGSVFEVELSPPSTADQLRITGAATLQGGTVKALRGPGNYVLGQQYNILDAAGGVNGKFTTLDQAAISPFINLSLMYLSKRVQLNVARGQALASAATTANQRGTASALDSLPDSNALLGTMVSMDAASASRSFDQLSGEIHPANRTVLAEGSRHLRDVALSRARTGHDGFTSQAANTGVSLWADVLTAGATLRGDANSAAIASSGSQSLVGGDYQFENGWRLGALGGIAHQDIALPVRGSKSRINSRLLGVYGGQRWGRFGLHAGYTQASHVITTDRDIVIPGISHNAHARYQGSTQQLFAEGSYRLGTQAWELEPYLQHASIKLKTDAFAENGGVAALRGAAAASQLQVSTLGLRGRVNLKGSGQDQTWLSLRGGVGYRLAAGDRAAGSSLAFNGSQPFAVMAAPIARKATVAELGLQARMSPDTLLELGYSGQYAGGQHDHAGNMRFSIRF